MTSCRWDADAGDYLTDGENCRHDEYGDPTRHCQARRTCSQHVGWGEITCARCIGRVRRDIRTIVERSALLLPVAAVAGVNSEAAMLYAAAADPRGWLGYRLAAIGHLDHWWHVGRIKERQYDYARSTIDDDEFHPYNVLTRWHMMLAEDYDLELPSKMTVAGSAGFLDRILGRMAQDEAQDFGLFRQEMRRCRQHLDSVLALNRAAAKQRGAPCPTCKKADAQLPIDQRRPLVRLVREYPHWCEDEACEKVHVETDELDVWVCPRNDEHWWTPGGYANLLDERAAGHSDAACA